MQGKVTIYLKDNQTIHIHRVHYILHNYDIDALEIGYNEVGSCIVKTCRYDLKLVDSIMLK